MIKTFSANSLNLFLKSKDEFYKAFVLKIPSLYMENYAKSGKKLHALISYKLRGLDVKKIKNTLSDKEKIYWDNIYENEIFKLNTIAVEQSFLVKIDNYWLTGRFDAIFENNEKILVYDWKTGKIPGEDDLQTLVYLYCASKLYKTDNLCVTYVSLADKSEKTFNFKGLEPCSTRILDLIKSINSYIG